MLIFVISKVWEGREVISWGRKLIGKTNPMVAELGTIRGDYGIDVGRSPPKYSLKYIRDEY